MGAVACQPASLPSPTGFSGPFQIHDGSRCCPTHTLLSSHPVARRLSPCVVRGVPPPAPLPPCSLASLPSILFICSTPELWAGTRGGLCPCCSCCRHPSSPDPPGSHQRHQPEVNSFPCHSSPNPPRAAHIFPKTPGVCLCLTTVRLQGPRASALLSQHLGADRASASLPSSWTPEPPREGEGVQGACRPAWGKLSWDVLPSGQPGRPGVRM